MHTPSTTMRAWDLIGAIKRSPFADLVSLPFFILRSSSAGGAVIAGLIQTFVFARVLPPEQFSIFILVGALGLTMWTFDFGLPKILFVRMRARHLAGEDKEPIAGQADALFAFYVLLIGSAALLCFAFLVTRPAVAFADAVQYGLFFLFCALNLPWFVLRNLSVATDEFVFFESLEVARRIGHMAVILTMLIGLPMPACLIAVNLMWVVLFVLMTRRLLRRGAMTLKMRGIASRLSLFFRENGSSAVRTGAHAACEIYTHNLPYLVVPLAFGLGAPTIILDTTFKVFFGALVLYSAACDILVPRQTRAFAEQDSRTLVRATLAALGLSAVPALLIGALLLFGGDRLFAILLASSATMPAAATPIILTLLAAGIAKTAGNSLLQHTGSFLVMSRISIGIAAALSVVVLAAIWARLDMIGLLTAYAAVYAAGGLFYLWFSLAGPVRAARKDRTC